MSHYPTGKHQCTRLGTQYKTVKHAALLARESLPFFYFIFFILVIYLKADLSL